MEKFTQKQLKGLIKEGVAMDITHSKKDIIDNLLKIGVTQVGYSSGIYGCNGMLLKDNIGKLYAITDSTSNLFCF